MLQNVQVKNKYTGEDLGAFEQLSDVESDQKTALRERFGAGAYKLAWGEWRKIDGKKRNIPRTKVLYISENGVIPSVRSAPGIPQPAAGIHLDSNSAMLFQLIMQKIDERLQQITDRIDGLYNLVEELFEEEEGGEGAQVPTAQSGVPSGDLMSDPRYAGLFGAILFNAQNPEKLGDAIKAEVEKDPAIIQGLIQKLMGGAS